MMNELSTLPPVQSEAPELGVAVADLDVRVSHVGGAPYELHYKAQTDGICIGLSPFGVVCARDSDKISKCLYRPGSLVFLPAGTRVYERCETPEHDFVFLVMPKRIRSEILAEMPAPLPKIEPRQFDSVRDGAHLGWLAASYVDHGGIGRRLVTESLATFAMATALHLLTGRARPDDTGNSKLNLRGLLRAQEYIEAHLSSDLSLYEIASVARMSPSHFSRSFKTHFGETPSRYVVGRRVARVRDMLGTTELSLGEIAYAVGFASQSHMTAVFRSQTSTTPGRYRRILKG